MLNWFLSLMIVVSANVHAIDFDRIDSFKGAGGKARSTDQSDLDSSSMRLQNQFIEEDNEARRRRAQNSSSNGNARCYDIKNDALKAYCERGESACSEFGYSRYREKFLIPRWVEDFCKHNYSIGDKALDDYYRYGYTAQFKGKVYDSALKFFNDQGARKRWVIHYANGYLLKPY